MAAEATTHVVDVGGHALRVLDEGDGPVVLLLHGFPDRAELWRYVGQALRTAGRRTLAVDLPGMGESTIPARRRAHALEAVAQQLVTVLSTLEIDDVDVVGHDWGAAVGWAFCARHPRRVRRHVALSVGHPWAFLTAGLDQLRRSSYMMAWQVPGLTERVLAHNDFAVLRRFVDGQHPDIDRAIDDLARPGRLRAGLNLYRSNLQPPRRLPNCPVPSLGILPTADKSAGETQMTRTARYVDADWRIEHLDGVGHWAPLEAPDEVARLVLRWLDA